MASVKVPFCSRVAHRAMVCAADQLASSAGIGLLAAGGSAADAAVGAAAVMATTSPHLCGLGGDVLAMVSAPGGDPEALLGAGRAGTGADPGALRAAGHRSMPLRGEWQSVTVPGCVDGWLALHERYGRLALTEVLAPAIDLATEGFAASGLLAAASALVAHLPGAEQLCPDGPLERGDVVRLPGIARTLAAVAQDGRDGFYGGEAGRLLLELGRGLYVERDLATPLADWAEPATLTAFGHRLWTVPPPSQGYLTLAAAAIAERVGLADDPDDPAWAHMLIEAARAAGHDRPAVLFDGAEPAALLDPARLAAAAARIDLDRAAPSDVEVAAATGGDVTRLGDGDTTHLCALDGDGLGVSLTQSNALDFGAHLVLGDTGIFLHDRGLGFSLDPGHPAELAGGRRPPHTLSPLLVTGADGRLAHLVGTMGGDGQPQINLQLLARLLRGGADGAVAAGRFVLDAPDAGPFRAWHGRELTVRLEAHAPAGWPEALAARGHKVATVRPLDPVAVGCAQVISTDGTVVTGQSDPRSPEGGAVGR